MDCVLDANFKFRHSRGGGSENPGKCNLMLLEKRRIQDVTHSKWFRVSPSVPPYRSLAFSFVDPIVCVNMIPVFIYTDVYRRHNVSSRTNQETDTYMSLHSYEFRKIVFKNETSESTLQMSETGGEHFQKACRFRVKESPNPSEVTKECMKPSELFEVMEESFLLTTLYEKSSNSVRAGLRRVRKKFLSIPSNGFYIVSWLLILLKQTSISEEFDENLISVDGVNMYWWEITYIGERQRALVGDNVHWWETTCFLLHLLCLADCLLAMFCNYKGFRLIETGR